MNADLEPTRASLAEMPEYRVHRGSSSGISQQVEASPAYVIDWNDQICQRTFLSSVDELRAEIARGKNDHASRLFVIHGLPADHVKALRNSLEIDPAFIEAHAGRRRYRPLRWRKDARFAHYEYPELVRGFDGALADHAADHATDGTSSRPLRSIDLMDDPAVRSISDSGDVAAVFCRCSLWITPQADVLFLDRPLWRDPSSPLRKARRFSSVTKPYHVRPGSAQQKTNVWDVTLADGDEIASLEDVLQETLKDANALGDELMDILSRLAYDHWIDLFELLDPHSQSNSRATVSFYWRIIQSLEQNADFVNYAGRQGRQPEASDANWQALLSRTQRRIELLPMSRSRPSLSKESSDVKKITRNSTLDSSARTTPAAQPDDESQRSLNRVAYMGGILIPLSIVSGILSMGDPFGPTGAQFWLFWAVSVPLVISTILIIYADTIRQAEVWVEVAAENVLALAPEARHVRVDTIKEKTETVTWHDTGRPNGLAGARRPALAPQQSVTYTVGEEEHVIDMPAPVAEETDETVGEIAGDTVEPLVILERPTDGSKAKAWKRQRLGWAGAVKAIVGYYKPRRAEDIPLGVAAYERRKTVTY